MAVNTILTLGSPIKDHLAPSMLGPAVNSASNVGGSSVAGGLSKTAALAGGATKVLTGGSSNVSLVAGGNSTASTLTGSGTGAGTHTATQLTGIGLTKTATLGSVFVFLLFIAAAGAVGYLGYRLAKGMWKLLS